jgi:hypothetical protein
LFVSEVLFETDKLSHLGSEIVASTLVHLPHPKWLPAAAFGHAQQGSAGRRHCRRHRQDSRLRPRRTGNKEQRSGLVSSVAIIGRSVHRSIDRSIGQAQQVASVAAGLLIVLCALSSARTCKVCVCVSSTGRVVSLADGFMLACSFLTS